MITKKIQSLFMVLILLTLVGSFALADAEQEAILKYKLGELELSSALLSEEAESLFTQYDNIGATNGILNRLYTLELSLYGEIDVLDESISLAEELKLDELSGKFKEIKKVDSYN